MRTIRLYDVAARLNISIYTAKAIIKEYGSEIEAKPNAFLSEQHIDALCTAYVFSVNNFYKKFNSSEELNEKERRQWKTFFSLFIISDEELNDDFDFSNHTLTKELIEEYFFSVVLRSNRQKHIRSFILEGISKYLFQIKKNYAAAKEIILSTITPHSLYKFVDEDSYNRIANNTLGFSVVTQNTLREACLKTTNIKPSNSHEKNRFINSKN